MILDTTIANIVTPPGKSGVGIIRISGDKAFNIIDKIFKPYDKVSFNKKEGYKVYFGDIVSSKGNKLDEALVLIMKGPNSFTGDDTVEIQGHGNPFILKEILKEIVYLGGNISEAGEFTRRAFLNGKLDLTQSEGILDTINATNKMALKHSLGQVDGKLKSSIKDISNSLMEIISYLEATIDFPDDEIDDAINIEDITRKINSINKVIENLLQSYNQGKLIKEGVTTVLIGKPNAGKSSLLNSFLKEDRAIITELPGTTRDAIEEKIILDDLTLKIVDTAGFRETDDKIEKIGITKTYEYIEIAQLVILLIDVSKGISKEDKEMIEYLNKLEKNYLIVYNKADLVTNKSYDNGIYISAKEGFGLDELMLEIKNIFLDKDTKEIYLNNFRYYESFSKAKESIEIFIRDLGKIPNDLLTISLRDAYLELSSITGENFTDDLLDKIFNQFCIGK